ARHGEEVGSGFGKVNPFTHRDAEKRAGGISSWLAAYCVAEFSSESSKRSRICHSHESQNQRRASAEFSRNPLLSCVVVLERLPYGGERPLCCSTGLVQGEDGELQTVSRSGLSEDALQVSLYCVFTDVELVGDVSVLHSPGYRIRDLTLAVRESVQRGLRRRGRS